MTAKRKKGDVKEGSIKAEALDATVTNTTHLEDLLVGLTPVECLFAGLSLFDQLNSKYIPEFVLPYVLDRLDQLLSKEYPETDVLKVTHATSAISTALMLYLDKTGELLDPAGVLEKVRNSDTTLN